MSIYRDAYRHAEPWAPSHWYHIGDRVKWCGMLLRCGVDHYAGEADHPWDPGWGWGDAAALLWFVLTPDFLTQESDHMRATIEALRVRQTT